MSDHFDRALTGLLDSVNRGRVNAFAQLVDLVYDDLRAIAAGNVRRHFDRTPEQLTLQPTVFVHDVLLKLREQRRAWASSEQFFAVATRILRRLLVDYQRERLAMKRGGRARRGAAIEAAAGAARDDTGPARADVADLLDRLHDEHPRAAEVVTLHVLCAHPLPDVARRLDMSLSQIERDWRFARAWLTSRLEKE